MSDEARNAHLDWLDDCAKEQGEDYETWLEKRVGQLEEVSEIARGILENGLTVNRRCRLRKALIKSQEDKETEDERA